MGIFRDYFLPIIVGVALLGFVSFFFATIYWFFGKLGIKRFFKIGKLKRKFKKDFEFDDISVEVCEDFITRKWKFKDIQKFTKGNPEQDRILYTYYLLKKMKTTKKIV